MEAGGHPPQNGRVQILRAVGGSHDDDLVRDAQEREKKNTICAIYLTFAKEMLSDIVESCSITPSATFYQIICKCLCVQQLLNCKYF